MREGPKAMNGSEGSKKNLPEVFPTLVGRFGVSMSVFYVGSVRFAGRKLREGPKALVPKVAKKTSRRFFRC